MPRLQADGVTIQGHPTTPLLDGDGNETGQLITVCADCGSVRTIIMLVHDRWYCSKCRSEGRITQTAVQFPVGRLIPISR